MSRSAFLAGALLWLLLPGIACCEQPGISKTATFSTMYYNEEGGDLLGEEIRRIVYTSAGFEAAYQEAIGGPSRLVVVPITITEDNEIEFIVPERGDMTAGTFRGKIEAGRIVGVLTTVKGYEISMTLPRKKSYWD